MRVLAARLDNDGDVLLTGPAVRALAARADVDVLASPAGAGAARLLPGVDEVLVFDPPWSGFSPPAVDAAAVDDLVARVRERGYDEAVVFTSFHQSPLPLALLLRLAGVRRISATSEDYPGALLDVRHRREGTARADVPEAVAALDLAAAAGFPLPDGDDGRLRVLTTARVPEGLPASYVVVHPGASVPARAPLPEQAAGIVEGLRHAGREVVVTGGPGERGLTAAVAVAGAVDLGGRTGLPELAAVLAAAEAVVVGNTGPAHLAAAVGTPVVSLFAPVVPAARWAPHGVPHVVLGDQGAACRGTRARECPVPGHPCLAGVSAREVVAAVEALAPAVPGAAVEEVERETAPAGGTS
ncbi:glycosyltransferase family 9 protein [Kineococcus esterisolvens]|uniref:glycosyltransferase family 9 protein n=1 Tax=unclassified Kineococcus TaxID=2621656 RepID=UPI003D7E18A3